MTSRLGNPSINGCSWDVVVVGAGAAGLMTCLEMSKSFRILLLNRNTSRRSSSRWAQGGIAAVTRPDDSLESHASDTYRAGAGLCDKSAVEMFVNESPKIVERLQKLGMDFDREFDQLATTLEAAHSHRRVLHVKDRTGRALVDVLEERVEQSLNITHKRGVRVTQIWKDSSICCGVQVLDGNSLYWIPSRVVVLATGGGGHLFANTTNPPQANGEGIALSWRAGADIEDLEFVQFHPTALRLNNAPSFLLTEALRGEGAFLVDNFGKSPVSHLKGGDLAPRDQVSRALDKAMKSQDVEFMNLDLSAIPDDIALARFPTILHRCQEFGLNPLKEKLPVSPAAHYWMGGVATDLDASTSVKGLFAVGEVACTGIHGANRLASNSLMECLVFAKQMAKIQLDGSIPILKKPIGNKFINFSNELKPEMSEQMLVNAIKKLRSFCWAEAGVNRSSKGMKLSLNAISEDMDRLENEALLCLMYKQPADTCYQFDEKSRFYLNLLIDLNNRQLTSFLLFRSCLFRKESRGGHFRLDFPKPLPYWKCHSVQSIGKNLFTREVLD